MYACFQGLRELGFHREDIRILWCRCPQLAVINPHGRPAALLNWLESLGLSRAAALKTLKRQPQMAGLSIINNLEPSLEFLKETLDLSPEALGRVGWWKDSILKRGGWLSFGSSEETGSA